MIRLQLSNLRWLGDTPEEKQKDFCLHGHVFFKLDDDIISDDEWCVSAAALRLMRSVFSNHFMGEEQHMFPCCGHFMIPSNDSQSVDIIGCRNGIDFDVLHEEENIVIKTDNSKTYSFSFYEYRDIVFAFADEVNKFINNSPERFFEDEIDRKGFLAFKNEWLSLFDKVKIATLECVGNISIDYSQYKCISEKDIYVISSGGISHKHGFINFRECAYYYKAEHGGDGKCVGVRDITGSSKCYIFYTAPVTTHIFFTPKGKLAEFFSKASTYQRFCDLEKQLNRLGYTVK